MVLVRPGVNVISRSSSSAKGVPTDTGVWFTVGLADEGPANKPTLLRNLGDFTRIFGPRVSYSVMYDAMETYFREGGESAYFVRVVGPAAAVATLILNDRAVSPLPTLRVDAIGPGAYGSTIQVAVIAGTGANQFKLQITRGGVVVETSPDLNNPTDAVNWGLGSNYVRVTDLASGTVAPNNNPAVLVATALAGGADDRGNVTDTTKTTALLLYTAAFGPGQVSVPGATTTAIYTALRAHARDKNREAILDAPDTPTVGTLTALNAGIDDEYGATFAPWVVVPGIVANTTRIVPPSAYVAAKMAATDAAFGPNTPAAGVNGAASWAIGVSQSWVAADRQSLNDARIDVIRLVGDQVRTYGYRTNADPTTNPNWVSLNNQRLRMAITAEAMAIGESYVFGQMDGRGHFFAAVAGDVSGVLLRHFNEGALYGESPDEAFAVDTGPQVNTPTTIANRELHIVVAAKMSEFAEMVVFEIVKVGLTGTV